MNGIIDMFLANALFVSVIALISCIGYIYWFIKTKDWQKIGTAFTRLILMGGYFYIWLFSPPLLTSRIIIRDAVCILLIIEIIYHGFTILQQIIKNRAKTNGCI